MAILNSLLIYQYILQVKQWITFHDPYTFVYGGYGRKDMAPGINGPAKTVYKAATNVLQSHAAAFRLYKRRYEAAQKGSIVLQTYEISITKCIFSKVISKHNLSDANNPFIMLRIIYSSIGN